MRWRSLSETSKPWRRSKSLSSVFVEKTEAYELFENEGNPGGPGGSYRCLHAEKPCIIQNPGHFLEREFGFVKKVQGSAAIHILK